MDNEKSEKITPSTGSEEITILDVLDKITRCRSSVGFIADRIEDNQASSAMSLVESAMEDLEKMLQFMIDGKLKESI